MFRFKCGAMSCDIMSGCDFVSLVGYVLCVMSCQSLTEQSCLLDSAMFNFFALFGSE